MACVVSNTSNFGISGVTALPWSDISDGMLDVVLLPTSSVQAFLALIATTAGLEELAGVLRRWQVQHVIVHADPPQQITCDGDMVGKTPVEITIQHKALKVIVPDRATMIRPGVV
jgi:diacylglycerol kinase family enzyme